MVSLRGHWDVMREVRVEEDGLVVGLRPSRGPSGGRGALVYGEQDSLIR